MAGWDVRRDRPVEVAVGTEPAGEDVLDSRGEDDDDSHLDRHRPTPGRVLPHDKGDEQRPRQGTEEAHRPAARATVDEQGGTDPPTGDGQQRPAAPFVSAG